MSILSEAKFFQAGADAETAFRLMVDKVLGQVDQEAVMAAADSGQEAVDEVLDRFVADKQFTLGDEDGTEIFVYRWREGERGLARGISIKDNSQFAKFVLWPVTKDDVDVGFVKSGLRYDVNYLDNTEPNQLLNTLDSVDLFELEDIINDHVLSQIDVESDAEGEPEVEEVAEPEQEPVDEPFIPVP